MVRSIAKKEFRAIARDGRLWLLPLLFVMCCLGSYTGYRYYVAQAQVQQIAQAENYRQWLHQGEKNPHQGAHFGLYAFKPTPLLAMLDKGMSDYLGTSVWMEAHRQNDVKFRPIQERTTLARFGDLTVAFLLIYLMPLLIVMLTFNAFTAEKESGTLRLLLSCGVAPTRVLAGKFLGVFAVIGLLLAPLLITFNLTLALAGGLQPYVAGLGALALILFFLVLFYAVCTLVGMTVSALSRSSSVSMAILLSLWIVGSFVVPRANAFVAKKAYPTPSAIAFTRQVSQDKEAGVDGMTNAQRKAKLDQDLLERYQVERLEDLPVGYAGLSLQSGEDFGNKIFDKNYGGLHRQFALQDKLMAAGTVLSPVLATRQLFMGLAGTDLNQHVDFVNQAESHRRLIQRRVNEYYASQTKGKEAGQEAGLELWRQIPAFTYAEPSLFKKVSGQGLNIAVLLGWCLLTVLGSYVLVSKKISC